MAKEDQHISTLTSVAKQMHASPQNGLEKACLVRMPDGSERLALTQMINVRHLGSVHNGAQFCRVSFRFGGVETAPDCQYDQAKDTIWCIVDHKNASIVFGPTEGIHVRHPGIGIGSYLIAQLIRLLQQGDIRGNYQIHTMQLPVHAQKDVAEADVETNDARLDACLNRVGFYVSQAAGVKVVGVRRYQDLRPWWNQDRIRFLGFPQFVDLACQWQREKHDADRAVAVAQQLASDAKLHSAKWQDETGKQQARIAELEGQVQAGLDLLETLESSARVLNSSENRPVEPSVLISAASESATELMRYGSTGVNQNLSISLAPALMRFLWVGLGLASVSMLLYLAHIFNR